ncbi:cytidine deaminase-like protein [Ascodesmis nigricans]|uniref:Cytidine deaminase-like protein n=1 Tax=Ascodesmis nigricans TaxID=341454 RepID=A0A4S2N822_9PEZI|nr:cytidine deaminase-like protein [Ascodesmis nigricans]
MELQHLRRLARMPYMPKGLLATLPKPNWPPEISTLYLLMCTKEKATVEEVIELIKPTSPFQPNPKIPGHVPPEPQISVVPVPLHMPTSTEEAEEWSEKYWPTVYKRGNPFGPHPSIVETAEANLTKAREYIQMARDAGRQAEQNGVGLPFGAVMVNPTSGKVIAVAGDARHWDNQREWPNPLDHCAMRLVSMVAQKRLDKETKNEIVSPENPLRALTPLEEKYIMGPDNTQAGPTEGITADDVGSYLCHNLHVYLSHEPCTMCAMALLHSRVGAVIFEHRMGKTGALTADGFEQRDGVGHGLFWRPDLNWKFLCWEWKDRGVTPKDPLFDKVAA